MALRTAEFFSGMGLTRASLDRCGIKMARLLALCSLPRTDPKTGCNMFGATGRTPW